MSKNQKVQIDEKLVREIASLARLALTEEEIAMFANQFKDILDYVNVLNEVDTELVSPAYLWSANISVTRNDEIEESVPTEEFLANTPQSRDDYVLIPRVHIEQ